MHRVSAIRRGIAIFALVVLMGSLPCMGECLLADALHSHAPCRCHKHKTPDRSSGVMCHSDAAAPPMFSGAHVSWPGTLTAPAAIAPAVEAARTSIFKHPPDATPPPFSVLRI
jgi:hypothetical protein